MEWFTLVSTALGVVLGVGATNFNERVKWRRDRIKARYESQSKLFSEYLADLTKTRDEIVLVEMGVYPAGLSQKEAASRAFVAANAYPRRYQVRLTVGPELDEPATQALRGLRKQRDLLIAGVDPESDEYEAALRTYYRALGDLTDQMKAELDKLR